MAVQKGDLIFRDRFQFTPDVNGDTSTQWGRVNLQDYISVAEKQGLRVKEIFYHLRGPGLDAEGNTLTGVTIPGYLGPLASSTTTEIKVATLKIVATTRAYQDISEVGIGSPDVLAIEEWGWFDRSIHNGVSNSVGVSSSNTVRRYGLEQLHPQGFPIITDLLIGIATDQATAFAAKAMELDVVIVAEPHKFTQADVTRQLAQQMDV